MPQSSLRSSPHTSRLALTALASLAALAAPSIAHAGSYLSLGLGGEPALQGDLDTAAAGADGGNGRLALGQRFGRVSIEASLSRFGIPADDATAAGIHARLDFPLSGNVALYGRLGLERLWLGDTEMTASGDASGYVGAGGLEYRLKAPLLGQAALWAELSQDSFETEGGAQGGVRLWTLGASIGL